MCVCKYIFLFTYRLATKWCMSLFVSFYIFLVRACYVTVLLTAFLYIEECSLFCYVFFFLPLVSVLIYLMICHTSSCVSSLHIKDFYLCMYTVIPVQAQLHHHFRHFSLPLSFNVYSSGVYSTECESLSVCVFVLLPYSRSLSFGWKMFDYTHILNCLNCTLSVDDTNLLSNTVYSFQWEVLCG